jgi:hypothetical protein
MSILEIPITKAGKGVTFSVDTDDLNTLMESNPEAFLDILARGLKDALNSRMTKGIEAPSKLEGAALESNKAAALAKAEENFKDLLDGKLVKKSASKASAGVDRKVMSEAVRLAKEVVKNEIRKAGQRPSLVAAKDITAWAKQFVEEDPSYIEQAKLNLAEVEAKASKPILDIKSKIKLDPKLVAKSEKVKAERKTQLSAKQASMPAKRGAKVPPQRPGSVSHTAH